MRKIAFCFISFLTLSLPCAMSWGEGPFERACAMSDGTLLGKARDYRVILSVLDSVLCKKTGNSLVARVKNVNKLQNNADQEKEGYCLLVSGGNHVYSEQVKSAMPRSMQQEFVCLDLNTVISHYSGSEWAACITDLSAGKTNEDELKVIRDELYAGISGWLIKYNTAMQPFADNLAEIERAAKNIAKMQKGGNNNDDDDDFPDENADGDINGDAQRKAGTKKDTTTELKKLQLQQKQLKNERNTVKKRLMKDVDSLLNNFAGKLVEIVNKPEHMQNVKIRLAKVKSNIENIPLKAAKASHLEQALGIVDDIIKSSIRYREKDPTTLERLVEPAEKVWRALTSYTTKIGEITKASEDLPEEKIYKDWVTAAYARNCWGKICEKWNTLEKLERVNFLYYVLNALDGTSMQDNGLLALAVEIITKNGTGNNITQQTAEIGLQWLKHCLHTEILLQWAIQELGLELREDEPILSSYNPCPSCASCQHVLDWIDDDRGVGPGFIHAAKDNNNPITIQSSDTEYAIKIDITPKKIEKKSDSNNTELPK